MNNENSNPSGRLFPKDPSTGDHSPREQLDSLMSLAQQEASNIMQHYGRLGLCVIAASPEGSTLLMTGPLDTETARDNLAFAARLVCVAHAAAAAVVVLEAWVVEAAPGQTLDPKADPAQSPDRREYIILYGEAFGGVYREAAFPVCRNPAGQFTGLGPAKTLALNPSQGPFAHLLPPSPPPPEARKLARDWLRCAGLEGLDATFNN